MISCSWCSLHPPWQVYKRARSEQTPLQQHLSFVKWSASIAAGYVLQTDFRAQRAPLLVLRMVQERGLSTWVCRHQALPPLNPFTPSKVNLLGGWGEMLSESQVLRKVMKGCSQWAWGISTLSLSTLILLCSVTEYDNMKGPFSSFFFFFFSFVWYNSTLTIWQHAVLPQARIH